MQTRPERCSLFNMCNTQKNSFSLIWVKCNELKVNDNIQLLQYGNEQEQIVVKRLLHKKMCVSCFAAKNDTFPFRFSYCAVKWKFSLFLCALSFFIGVAKRRKKNNWKWKEEKWIPVWFGDSNPKSQLFNQSLFNIRSYQNGTNSPHEFTPREKLISNNRLLIFHFKLKCKCTSSRFQGPLQLP